MLSTREASQRLLKLSCSRAPLLYYEPSSRAVLAAVFHFGPGECQTASATRFQIGLLVEVDFQGRGLGAPRPAFSGRFGSVVINLGDQRFQMPFHEGAIPIFDATAVIATLQNLEPERCQIVELGVAGKGSAVPGVSRIGSAAVSLGP